MSDISFGDIISASHFISKGVGHFFGDSPVQHVVHYPKVNHPSLSSRLLFVYFVFISFSISPSSPVLLPPLSSSHTKACN